MTGIQQDDRKEVTGKLKITGITDNATVKFGSNTMFFFFVFLTVVYICFSDLKEKPNLR